jgi:hypothetical protein
MSSEICNKKTILKYKCSSWTFHADSHILYIYTYGTNDCLCFLFSPFSSLSPPLLQKNSHFTHTHTLFSALFFSFNTNIIYRSTRPLRSLSFSYTYLTLVEHLSVYNYRFARPLCRPSCDSIHIR